MPRRALVRWFKIAVRVVHVDITVQVEFVRAGRTSLAENKAAICSSVDIC
jgi:hypothetical protein